MNSKSLRLRRTSDFLCATIVILVFIGCGTEQRGDRVPTTGVTGQVLVDGTPVAASEPLQVICHCTSSEQQIPSQALTGEDGRFELSTYEGGDGVPAGDYVLTFFWGKINPLAGSYDGPDRLGERYTDVASSEIRFSVGEDDEPVALGRIPLTMADKP